VTPLKSAIIQNATIAIIGSSNVTQAYEKKNIQMIEHMLHFKGVAGRHREIVR